MRAQHRITDPKIIDQPLIESELKNGKQVIVQFSGKIYSDNILADINELCSKFDDNFSVRFFGHYQGSFDCKTLLKLTNIKALWLDCLLKVDNLKVLTELKNLKRLSLGVLELRETEIFQADNLTNLKELIIGDTRTKALNLQYLENYKSLSYLIICGHIKNIDVVGNLIELEYLGLNSISKASLSFVNTLKKLKSLHISLGGRENLAEIEENEIESLAITMIRGVNSLENIAKFKKLNTLLIEDQKQLTEIHFQNAIPTLNNIKLINCKNFKFLSGLENLIGLQKLRISRTEINFDEFIKQPFPESLKILAFYTGKSKIDMEIKDRLLNIGFKDGLSVDQN